MSKYFHIENATRIVAGVVFEPYEIFGGCLMGVYKADKAEEITGLSAAASNPASAVTELTEAEYDIRLKKKSPGLQASRVPTRVTTEAPPAKATPSGAAAVVVEKQSSDTDAAPAAGKLQSVDEAVVVGPISASNVQKGKK